MTLNGWLQILIFFLVILAITKPMGVFMAQVFNREKTFLDPVLRPIERLIYKLARVDEEREMRWTEYAVSMLLFSAVSMLVFYLIQRLQGHLPFNPQHLPGVDSRASATGQFVGSAFNTAASFTTNTNWQSYVPETTMSYFTQMAGLAYHNFVSAAVGIALAIALVRGIAERETKTIGNFWVDITRCLLWILFPVCLIASFVFVSQGVVQNLKPYVTARLIEPHAVDSQDADGRQVHKVIAEQRIAQGPVASQEAIKMAGTNGGGFFTATSAPPSG